MTGPEQLQLNLQLKGPQSYKTPEEKKEERLELIIQGIEVSELPGYAMGFSLEQLYWMDEKEILLLYSMLGKLNKDDSFLFENQNISYDDLLKQNPKRAISMLIKAGQEYFNEDIDGKKLDGGLGRLSKGAWSQAIKTIKKSRYNKVQDVNDLWASSEHLHPYLSHELGLSVNKMRVEDPNEYLANLYNSIQAQRWGQAHKWHIPTVIKVSDEHFRLDESKNKIIATPHSFVSSRKDKRGKSEVYKSWIIRRRDRVGKLTFYELLCSCPNNPNPNKTKISDPNSDCRHVLVLENAILQYCKPYIPFTLKQSMKYNLRK